MDNKPNALLAQFITIFQQSIVHSLKTLMAMLMVVLMIIVVAQE